MNKMHTLNAEQAKVLYRILHSSNNIFITGEAGTGKSYLIKAIQDALKEQGMQVVLCAPTGIAAEHIGGVTIHSLFGLTAGPCITEKTNKIKVCTTKALRSCDVLIIDEISMVRIDLFDAIFASLQKIRAKGKNIRIIVVGDFHQLPPICEEGEKEMLDSFYHREFSYAYAFLAKAWEEFRFESFILTQQMRQDNSEYIYFLNLIRIGDPRSLDYFNRCSCPNYINGATTLCLYNNAVETENRKNLISLEGDIYVIPAVYMGNLESKDLVGQQGDLLLKPGARVIITTNDVHGVNYDFYEIGNDSYYPRKKFNKNFVNGSMGTVIEAGVFNDPSSDYVLVDVDYGPILYFGRNKKCIYEYQIQKAKVARKSKGSINQIPLRLAYALTIHKSQGMTLAAANIDVQGAWSPGLLYVALSRVTDIRNIHLIRPLRKEDLIVDPLVKEFYEHLRQNLKDSE
jgi:ATP-dependent exoDNAse (exonuclease V) alpha subunit